MADVPIRDKRKATRVERLPYYALRFVGCALVLLAGLGLWYNGGGLFAAVPPDPSLPYLLHAFCIMSAICVACYVTLLVIGIQFIRLNSSLLRLFIGIMIFEVVYFFSLPFVWMTPVIGASVGAASGVANGGLMFQFVPLFPLWGSLLARWAKQEIEASQSDGDVLFFAEEQICRPSDWPLAAIHFVVTLAFASLLIGMIWQQFAGTTSTPALLGSGIPILLSVLSARASLKGRRKRRREDIEQRHAHRLRAGLCPRCEYNLTGLTEARCPECGIDLPARILANVPPPTRFARSTVGGPDMDRRGSQVDDLP